MEDILVKMMRKSIAEFQEAILEIEKIYASPILKTMLIAKILENIRNFENKIEIFERNEKKNRRIRKRVKVWKRLS